ncbi:MAG: LptF/LptG family permease [Saprospiraceae bacterium]|nr:LptF/LptG family permease [Saprospiraceae bacterium]
MKILDWYIIKKYLSTFFFTMMLITMIAITIDYFERVDKFINAELSTKEIIMEYYLHFIPWINGLLWPLFALLAVIFFTSRMAKNSEIISILSAKVSYARFIRPYMIAGGTLALLLWIGNNYVIPKSNRLKNEFESEYIYKSAKTTLNHNIHFWLSPTEKVYIRSYTTSDSSGRIFRLERFADNKLVYVLKANKIKFIGQPNKWKLEDYEIRTFGDMSENLIPKPTEHKDTTFSFVPKDFTRYTKQMEMMNTSDLREFLKYEQEKGLNSGKKYSIELYRRTADPFTIFILTLIGVSVASRKVRGGMGFHLAAGVVIGAVFVIISKFSMTFSTNLALPPGIGVWIPNMFFSVVAFFLVKKCTKVSKVLYCQIWKFS